MKVQQPDGQVVVAPSMSWSLRKQFGLGTKPWPTTVATGVDVVRNEWIVQFVLKDGHNYAYHYQYPSLYAAMTANAAYHTLHVVDGESLWRGEYFNFRTRPFVPYSKVFVS